MRGLRRLGPTWAASPLRRLVQAACFVLFLALFGYVAWPYTARPARVWAGWLPVEVDAATGRASVQTEQPPRELLPVGIEIYVADQGNDTEGSFGVFRVTRAGAAGLELEPASPLDPRQLEKLSASFGPWTLHESDPSRPASHYADNFFAKEKLPAESFLVIDPLMSLSTALASRTWGWSLAFAAAILAVCLAIPRGFCAYVCPLGTTIDVFDGVVGRRVKAWLKTPYPSPPTPLPQGERGARTPYPSPPARLTQGVRLQIGLTGEREARRGRARWVGLKYFVLLAVLVAAGFGVLVSGYVSAIPVLTRALAYTLTPLETAMVRGWHQVPPFTAAELVSLGLFLAILGLGFLSPRFWCRYVCPTGAIFSLGNVFRLTERKVRTSCVGCGKCVEICPFDAIELDYTTRAADCTFCQTCGGACPVGAIEFVGRWSREELKGPGARSPLSHSPLPLTPAPSPARGEGSSGAASRERFLQRRGFLAAGIGLAATAGGAAAWGARTQGSNGGVARYVPVRPPGSVPEPEFLRRCIRCGECLQACPNAVLQPLGLELGLDGLWTPQAVADWSGCEPSCNLCGQVCPTGAIRALPLEEKRAARMGLAVIDQATCLPYAGRGDCRLCVDECSTALYNAIEFVQMGTQVNDQGQPIEGTGFLAPVVLAERCAGCGLCQTRCLAINGAQKRLLGRSAIRVEAGEGKEDRVATGSYLALRRDQARKRNARQNPLPQSGAEESYLPDFLK